RARHTPAFTPFPYTTLFRSQRRGDRRGHPAPAGLRHHRRVGQSYRPLRDRAGSTQDRRIRRRDRRPPGRGIDVRPGGPGRARHRAGHAHPAVPARDEVPAQRRPRGRGGQTRHAARLITPIPRDPRLQRRAAARPMETDMSNKKTFYLPDLGEGLPDATIVEWNVKEGDTIKLDDALVSMETAKAIVEVPSPVSGKVLKLAGAAGDVITTGAMLAEFEVDPSMPQRAEGQDTGHHHGGPAKGVGSDDPAADHRVVASDDGGAIEEDGEAAKGEPRKDSGTVVGAMQSSDTVRSEQASSVGGVKAMPAVRALARKLKVDLTRVRATGADGVVTMADVKQAAADGSAQAGSAPAPRAADRAPAPAPAAAPTQRSTLSQGGKPMRTQPP